MASITQDTGSASGSRLMNCRHLYFSGTSHISLPTAANPKDSTALLL